MAVLKPTTTLASEYAVLHLRRQEVEKDLTAVKESMARLGDQLLGRFSDEGVKSIRTSFGLVSLRHQIWASCIDVEALAQSEWGWLVKPSVNSQTLSSTVRELESDADGNIIWPSGAVKSAVKVTDRYLLRVTQS